MTSEGKHAGPVISAGVLLGVGLGGFVDGILFHQLLQWHNMLSSWMPPTDVVTLKVNMIWDGVFHAFTWFTTCVGIALLWRAGKRDDVAWVTRSFAGGLLVGWGSFNLAEGVVDHHLLGAHHVHPGAGQLAWDLAFLALGLVLCVVGTALIRSGRHHAPPAPRLRRVPMPT